MKDYNAHVICTDQHVSVPFFMFAYTMEHKNWPSAEINLWATYVQQWLSKVLAGNIPALPGDAGD